MKDTRCRAAMIKRYKMAWVGNDIEVANRIYDELDNVGQKHIRAWQKARAHSLA
jgi:hypothetical protein